MEMQLTKVEDLSGIAKAFAESGMFTDVKSASQALVKIMAGSEMGIPPFAAMSGVHIIQGKPTVGAGLLASRVQGSGKYKYVVKHLDEKSAKIEFFERTQTGWQSIGESSFTIEDAKKAGTKNLDKFPRNMLFARALSNGVKWYTPDLFGGPVYVPGEIPVGNDVEDGNFEVLPDTVDALNGLAFCETLDDLKAWKDTFASVVNNTEVRNAAKARHLELTKLQKEAI